MALYQNTEHDAMEAAEHLLAYYNHGEYPRGGSFTTKLIEVWEAADMTNRAALSRAFPAMGWASLVLSSNPTGADTLRGLVSEYKAKQKASQN